MPRPAPTADATIDPTDEALARDARAGCLASFESLLARFEPRLMGFFRSRGVPGAAAEDLFQETALNLWTNLHQYDPDRPFTPWLFTIAARLAIKDSRRRRRRGSLEIAASERSKRDPSRPSEPPDHALEQTNVWRLASELLSPESHAALWLRYAEDMDPRHIGAALGRTPGSVRVLLHRARRRLEDALAATASGESP